MSSKKRTLNNIMSLIKSKNMQVTEKTTPSSIGLTSSEKGTSSNSTFQAEQGEESKQLIKYEDIETTPFTLVSNDVGYWIAWGRYALTLQCNTKDEALSKLEEHWNIHCAFTLAVLDAKEKNGL